MNTVTLVALLVVTGAPPEAPGPSRAVATVAEAWLNLPTSGNGCGDELGFDYGLDGGMRNFYCRALSIFPWWRLTSVAPAPFVSGPHREHRLVLDAKQSFGHYNPEFVRWASKALVPAAGDAALRKKTQPIYDAQVRTLARLYFQVWRVASKDPKWLSAERTRYRDAIARGGGDWNDADVELYETMLGTSGSDWGGNDPNLVRSATLWWLRRSIDETAPLWLEGLERLLSTYDAKWLGAQREKTPPNPPRREPARK